MKIPQQLKRDEFRFVPIPKRSKAPFEKNWQDSNNYKWSEEPIQKAINNGGNYGVVCGPGDLAPVDSDIKEVEEEADKQLPETFKVRTGGGGCHKYYYCPDLEKTITLKNSDGENVGHVKGPGTQVVGPGSIHPNGNEYEVVNNERIKKVSASELKFALRKWIDNGTSKGKSAKNYDEEDLAITDVVDLSKLTRSGDEYYGAHPIHESETGRNFWVNPEKNAWRCFRCDSGGGPLMWLAVKYEVIDCAEARPGALQDEKFVEVIERADREGILDAGDYLDATGGSKKSYFEDGKFVPKLLGEDILNEKKFITMEETEQIYIYDGGIFEPKGKTTIKNKAQEKLGADVKNHYVNEALEYVRRNDYGPAENFGGPEHLLACENGVLNLETQELEDYDPALLMLSKIPVKYDPDADYSEIEKFFKEVVDEKDVPILQEFIGFCLWKEYWKAKALMLHGEGRNGKSRTLELIETFLGEENTATPSLHKLCYNDFAQIDLLGKLANIHADIPMRELTSTGNFKMLTGGDTIEGEQKHVQKKVNFKNYAKLMYSTNKLPKVEDMTDAFFRRWMVIDFPHKFTENPEDGFKDADPNVIEKLATEENLSGMLNWALGGLKRLRENKQFTNSKSAAEIKQRWIARSDSLRYFVNKEIEINFDSHVSKKDFYNAYREFCSLNNLDIEKKSTVTTELPTMIPETYIYRPKGGEDKRPRCWKNIKLPDRSQQELVAKVLEIYRENNEWTKRKLITAISDYYPNENEKRIGEAVERLERENKDFIFLSEIG